MVNDLTVTSTELTMASIQELEARFAIAVRQRDLLEKYIKERLNPGKHFYTVNEGKPSLTKEGAELICLPHNLKPRYEQIAGPASPLPDNAPYQLTVKCSLWNNDKFGGEGIGSASSYITTRSGQHKPRQNDPGLCHNATLKMAQKSAYIAATLNATAASEFFTQDIEDSDGDLAENKNLPGGNKEHFCNVHNTPFFKKGKMKQYAHPIGDTGEWCNEEKTGTPAMKAEDDTNPPDLALLQFKNAGEFKEACLRYFGLQSSQVDKEVSLYDLSKPDQRSKAWLDILSVYGKKEE